MIPNTFFQGKHVALPACLMISMQRTVIWVGEHPNSQLRRLPQYREIDLITSTDMGH